MAQCYFRVGKSNYYEMKTGECTSVNAKYHSISKVTNIPTASMNDVTVISKEEFDNVLQIVMESFKTK